MKQTFKRAYGTVAAIAIVSGITGAFAYSFASSAIKSTESEIAENTIAIDIKESKIFLMIIYVCFSVYQSSRYL